MNGLNRLRSEPPIDLREKRCTRHKRAVGAFRCCRPGLEHSAEDLPLPVAVLKERALHHNSQWMKTFLGTSGALIAPHGKTTMAPGDFRLQIADRWPGP